MVFGFVTFIWVGLISLMGCNGAGNEPSVPKVQAQNLLGVTTTNFQTGALAVFDPLSLDFHLTFAPISSDAVPRHLEGYADLFVLNRLGADNIQRIDRVTGKTISQFSFGRGSNPQDIKKIGSSVFVSLLDEPRLLLWNLEKGLKESEISLREFADSDGLPEASQMYVFEGELWVQLQRLNRAAGFIPSGESLIAIISPQTKTLSKTISMKGTNPVTPFKKDFDGYLLVANAGLVGLNSRLDGGIEKVDPVQKKSLGFLVTEQELGGDLVDFECASISSCVAIISKPETHLVHFDPRTGKKLKTLWTSTGYHLLQILRENKSGLLYVADSNPLNPMIRVWSEESLEQLEERNWLLELPPYQMEWF